VADRVDFFFRQRVTEAELDLAFELLEKADHNLASDLGVFGVIAGAIPLQHAPLPDLSLDLTGSARAYDRLGQRIFFGAGQRVNLAVDLTGIPTEVPLAGQERWLGVFLRFKRLKSDPRTDGNSQQIFFRQDESFELVVRQAPAGPINASPRPALVDDELLLCDVKRRAGQTQVFDADVDLTRRQAFLFAQGNAVATVSGLWKAISKTANTAQTAFDSVDAILAQHLDPAALAHKAENIGYGPYKFLSGTNVRDNLTKLLDALTSIAPENAGAARIGARVAMGFPKALNMGTVESQLLQLLGWINDHLGAAAGAHNASAIAAVAHSFVAATSVQAQLQEIAADLTSAAAGQGAALLGSQALGGTPRAVPQTKLRDQLLALLNHLNAHLASPDHDSRYPRRIFSEAVVLAPATTKTMGILSAVPESLRWAYNLVVSGDQAQQPQYHWGPLSPQIQVWVDKDDASGVRLWARNNSNTRLYLTVNAYALE
jgi:hypothetical protein